MSLILLIGDRHAGKTTTCRRLAEQAQQRGFSVGGIVAPAVHDRDRCTGYNVLDLATGRSTRLATLEGPGVEQVGGFHFVAEGLALGRTALTDATERAPQLVIVDEVGPLELAGGGWSRQLDELARREGVTLFTLRRALAQQVAQRWTVRPPPPAKAGEPPHPTVCDLADGSGALSHAILKLLAE
jgi:nucleoside-triphosphatase THEP1